ncbi:transmembrane emp24 domain-containing protein 5 isoform X2 [Dunckerocampus dactyliophorus]|uniref:transmembrane emp24 domain-containing protein 5 isoform X2 n=1 Tax=Dunckerocampus dactyliophorus TaxID=161453 RepID=UPI002404A704|nr:transmembrane emp24 domain-containing protein 5 isoform X2 [Dunckerocampus dactyliophorus]
MEAVRTFFCVITVLFVVVCERFLALAAFSQSLDSDFTFTLPAGRKECFYQTMKKDASLEVEYQVLDGAGLDIDFHISSPSGQILYSDHHKSDGMHTTVSEKLIFFELILDNMDADEEPDDWKEYVHGTDMLDMKLEDIMDTINSVKARLGKSIQIQTVLRAFEARDRNLQESSYNRVNFWSVVNVVVMMLVSGVQVYLVRSLFEDQRKIRT